MSSTSIKMEAQALNLKLLYKSDYDLWLTETVQLEDKLTTNLQNYLADELPKIYQNALLIVQKKTQLNSLSKSYPYSLKELLDKQWFPLG